MKTSVFGVYAFGGWGHAWAFSPPVGGGFRGPIFEILKETEHFPRKSPENNMHISGFWNLGPGGSIADRGFSVPGGAPET